MEKKLNFNCCIESKFYDKYLIKRWVKIDCRKRKVEDDVTRSLNDENMNKFLLNSIAMEAEIRWFIWIKELVDWIPSFVFLPLISLSPCIESEENCSKRHNLCKPISHYLLFQISLGGVLKIDLNTTWSIIY